MGKGIYSIEKRKGLFLKGHKINKQYSYEDGMSPQRAFYWRNKEKLRAYAKDRLRQRRLQALTYYCEGKPYCKCCKEETLEFLSFDHINGGGTAHRKKISSNIADYLIKNNYPDGYQVLCHNCNQAKSFPGGCPHNKNKK